MPVTAGEQRGFIGFGIGLLLVMTLVAWLSSNQKDQGEGSPSSYSVQPHGGKAAYLLLQQSGYTVERSKQPPAQLPADASGVMLVLAGPESYPHAEEMSGIIRFLMRGGSVLIAGVRPNSFVPQASSEEGDPRVGFAECKPVAPTGLTRGGPISQDGDLVWDSAKDAAVVHFVAHSKDDNDDKPVVVSYALGQGRVIWWASALPLTNAGIRDRGNLDLLLNSVGESRRILWDEYYHEEHAIASAHPSNPAQMWALAQAGFLGLLVILTFSRRSGPVVPLVRESRLSPLEFVETLGSVFHRAHGTQVATEIAFSRFQQVAARRLGIRGTTSANDILIAMAQRGIKVPADVATLVGRGEEASGDTELSEKQALEHVRALNQATRLLDPAVSAAKEKM
ncbi:MAG TPA: DUF4350 domain-containing protein [Candidatus Dormibacteraeota bacterium]|jgi:hypothetical protein|nr:DUF4350 domain-containing protein [Candidatus Dormibacteraeota bacterium]